MPVTHFDCFLEINATKLMFLGHATLRLIKPAAYRLLDNKSVFYREEPAINIPMARGLPSWLCLSRRPCSAF